MQISRDEFRKAVLKANDKYTEITKTNHPDDTMISLLMGLQNVAFGALIEETLFGEQEEN